jgi:hypothetical protein
MMVARQDWIAHDACTLPTAERPLREQEFDTLIDESLRAVERPGANRLRMTLRGRPGLGRRVRDLADRETRCCSFFTFTPDVLPTGEPADTEVIRLDVEVPQRYDGVLEALAGRARAALDGTASER